MRRPIIILLLAFAPLTGALFAQRECNPSPIGSGKALQKLYYELRALEKECKIDPMFLLKYAQRAYLAERYNEAIWASESALKYKTADTTSDLILRYTLGLSYIEKGRIEEAIITLRVVTENNSSADLHRIFHQKAHLALIKAYLTKAGGKVDQDVRFLANLFFHRYPKSSYTALLESILTN